MAAARRTHPESPRGSPVNSRSPASHPPRAVGSPDADGFYQVKSRRLGRSRSPSSPTRTEWALLQLPRLRPPPGFLQVAGEVLQLLGRGPPRSLVSVPRYQLQRGGQAAEISVGWAWWRSRVVSPSSSTARWGETFRLGGHCLRALRLVWMCAFCASLLQSAQPGGVFPTTIGTSSAAATATSAASTTRP